MINAGSFELFMSEGYTRKSSSVPSTTTFMLMGSDASLPIIGDVIPALSDIIRNPDTL
jgi:hypothetical protein